MKKIKYDPEEVKRRWKKRQKNPETASSGRYDTTEDSYDADWRLASEYKPGRTVSKIDWSQPPYKAWAWICWEENIEEKKAILENLIEVTDLANLRQAKGTVKTLDGHLAWHGSVLSAMRKEVPKFSRIINRYGRRSTLHTVLEWDAEERRPQQYKVTGIGHKLFGETSAYREWKIEDDQIGKQTNAFEFDTVVTNNNDGILNFQSSLKRLKEFVAWMTKQRTKVSKKLRVLEEAEQRRQQELAIIAKAEGRARDEAETVKSKLTKTKVCPYCQKRLTGTSHADHIIPVAMGGLSVTHNLVYICKQRNIKKSDKTLREFCLAEVIDFDEVAARLTKMGKRV